MIEFFSSDKKPKIRNMLYVSLFFFAVIAGLIVMKAPSMYVMTALLIYLFTMVLMLLKAFFDQLYYNPYSYNSIYYISFSLFVMTMVIAQIILIYNAMVMHLTEEQTLFNMMVQLVDSAQFFMAISAPLILVFSIALCVSNIVLIHYEGRRLVNLLGIILSMLMIGGEAVFFINTYFISGSMIEVMLKAVFFNVYAAVYLYYECMIIGTAITARMVVNYEPKKDKDYIIILGCGLMPDGTVTPLLKGRVDRAVKFYREQLAETGRAAILLPSGGQGPDEAMAESAAMRNYLLSLGIPDEHIIIEDRSTDTHQNMLYSKQIIDSRSENANVIYATTNYHVFRSGIKARQVGMTAAGIGSRTRWYYWPNALVREFVGILTEHRGKQALILGSMILIYALTTVFEYLH